jgi:hypothetical protein
VRTLTGSQLLYLDGRKDRVTAAIDDKKLTVTAKKADILALRRSSPVARRPAEEPAASLPDAANELKSNSTTGAFQRIKQSPEYALLPALSKELQKLGMAGNTYPPSLALHTAAMAAAKVLGLPKKSPGMSFRQKLPPQLRRPGSIFDQFAPGPSAGCWSGPEEGPNSEGLGPCPKQCTAYPNRPDDCLGMCGSGCECWSWVCGDCCHHKICLVHDALLRFCC